MRALSITKPGIIFGNIITATGGFFLGTTSLSQFNFFALVAMLFGISLIIASGCVFNNIIDRDIDKLMERTKHRVLAKGLMSEKTAFLYGVLFGLFGSLVLGVFTNTLTLLIALVGLFFYVIVYSAGLKRRSVYGTALGGISGAIPPVVGYTAATGRFDLGAVLIFFILFFWQLPHSYAIAIYRFKDYSAALIPVLPVKKGVYYTKISMLILIVLFAVAAVMPAVFGYTGILYFAVALCLGLAWFVIGLQGLKTQDDTAWAKKMFLFSIICITLISFMMIVK